MQQPTDKPLKENNIVYIAAANCDIAQ